MARTTKSGSVGFEFRMDVRRHVVSEEKMVAALREFAAGVGGRQFGQREFNGWVGKPCRGQTMARRLGGWKRALRLAGVEGVRHAGAYTPAELMEILEGVWREVGRPPGLQLLRRLGRVGYRVYERRWGSLRRACERLAKYRNGKISRAELLLADPVGAPVMRRLQPRVRWAVLERDGHRCRACGKGAEQRGVILEVDHIVAVCNGGSDEMGNLRTLCRACNRGRGSGKKRTSGRSLEAQSEPKIPPPNLPPGAGSPPT
jgi:hypothetical protein